MSAGATDGSALRNAGIPTYGQTGLAGDMEDVRVHGKDERVSVEAFYKGLDYHYRLVKALSEGHGMKDGTSRQTHLHLNQIYSRPMGCGVDEAAAHGHTVIGLKRDWTRP